MMRALQQKPTLDRPATYQIQVPGELDESWSDWIQGMTMAVESEGEGPPVTTLTGAFDQAALHGLLKKVRNLGMPLPPGLLRSHHVLMDTTKDENTPVGATPRGRPFSR